MENNKMAMLICLAVITVSFISMSGTGTGAFGYGADVSAGGVPGFGTGASAASGVSGFGLKPSCFGRGNVDSEFSGLQHVSRALNLGGFENENPEPEVSDPRYMSRVPNPALSENRNAEPGAAAFRSTTRVPEPSDFDLTPGDFVRFHVVANSNSREDQSLKLYVRDEVLQEITSELATMESVEESRQWLIDNTENVDKIAESAIKKAGYDYEACVEMGIRWIPEKNYGNIIMPAGNYEAFTIVIGEGKGENWWCVMFPPLCLIGEKPSDQDTLRMKKEFDGTKYEKIVNANQGTQPYVLKFKTKELLKGREN